MFNFSWNSLNQRDRVDGYFPESLEAFYSNAFGDFYQSIWEKTPFENEYRDLCLKHSLNIFLTTNSENERDRRKLLYYYSAPHMSVEQDSLLNRLRSILETDNLYIIKALRAICTLYLNAPSREILGSNQDVLNDIIANSNIDSALMKLHKAAKLSGEAAIRPIFIDGVLNFEIITSDNYRATYDYKGEIIEFWAYKPRIIENTVYDCFDVWTKDSYRVFEKSGVDVTKNNDIENPYNAIPYVVLNLTSNKIYGEVGDVPLWELLKAQLNHNRMKMLEDNTAIFNGFPIITYVNYQVKRNNFRISPGSVVTLEKVQTPENGMDALPYIDIQSQPAQYADLADLRLQNIKNAMRNMNLPNSMIDDNANLQSGVALEIDRIGLDEYRSEDRQTLKRFEQILINKIAEVAFVDINFNYNGSEYIVNIDYNEIDMPADAQADYDLQKSKFRDGLINPMQFLMKTTDIDKIESNEQAIALITENKNYYELIYGVSDGSESGADTTSDGTTDTIDRADTTSDGTADGDETD